jgi:hypothetical protein
MRHGVTLLTPHGVHSRAQVLEWAEILRNALPTSNPRIVALYRLSPRTVYSAAIA